MVIAPLPRSRPLWYGQRDAFLRCRAVSVEISSSDLMDDERLRGSITVRRFSGSLPVGEGGMFWSSTMEVEDAIGSWRGGGRLFLYGLEVQENEFEFDAVYEILCILDEMPYMSAVYSKTKGAFRRR